MCGIAGSIHFPLPVEAVQRQLRHRGPDEQSAWAEPPVQLIHARLRIQELSASGAQPMHHGSLVVVFNGEIYNHFDLRQKHRLQCNSHSDTETLLHLFEKMGERAFDELDGMFAFALYDREKQMMWCVRDRAGEKPFYYHRGQGYLVFASELNALQSVIRSGIDHQKISNFLAVGFLMPDETPYVDIAELSPGHLIRYQVNTNQMEIAQWWNPIPHHTHRDVSPSTALETVDKLLRQSVEQRLLSSDLEVGSFLSGGIDSGLVTAMAAQKAPGLQTFTVRFEGMYDESPLAAKVAQHLGTRHHEIAISFDKLDQDIESIFLNYGEPIMDDSIIPSYYVSKEARKHLTVILNGDAGDELFGGYRRYVPFRHGNLFTDKWRRLSRAALSVLPLPRDKKNSYNFIYRLVSLGASGQKDVYFASTNDLLFADQDVFSLPPRVDRYHQFIDNVVAQPWSPLQKIMALDFQLLLPTTLLVKMDIATMAHALEGRSPFLSKDLLAWAPGLEDNFKINGRTTKALLRTLAEKYLPETIITQPKRGFEVPLRAWVDTRLRSVIHDYLSPSNAYCKSILNPAFVQGLLNNAAPIPPEKRAKLLFALLSIEIWHKQQQLPRA